MLTTRINKCWYTLTPHVQEALVKKYTRGNFVTLRIVACDTWCHGGNCQSGERRMSAGHICAAVLVQNHAIHLTESTTVLSNLPSDTWTSCRCSFDWQWLAQRCLDLYYFWYSTATVYNFPLILLLWQMPLRHQVAHAISIHEWHDFHGVIIIFNAYSVSGMKGRCPSMLDKSIYLLLLRLPVVFANGHSSTYFFSSTIEVTFLYRFSICICASCRQMQHFRTSLSVSFLPLYFLFINTHYNIYKWYWYYKLDLWCKLWFVTLKTM